MRARAWAWLLVMLVGCRSSVVGQADPTRRESEAATITELPATVIHEATLVGNEVMLVGQQRASEVGSRAWVALADLSGRPRWTATLDGAFSWAETAIVDPHGTIHVFGHHAGGTSWLWRIDAEGRELGLDVLPHPELFGFELSATQVQVLVGSAELDDGMIAAAWLGLDWATGTSSLHAWQWSADSIGEHHYFTALGPGEFELGDEVYRVSSAADGQLAPLDDDEAEGARTRALASAGGGAFVEVPLGKAVALDLGGSSLWIAQLPPSADADARALLMRSDERSPPARLRTWLEAVAASSALTIDLNDPWAWAWAWSLVEELPPLSRAQQVSLGAWMLDAADCEPVDRGYSCDQRDLLYPIPRTYDPLDPCWKMGEIEAVLAATGREAAIENFDGWMALLEAGYVESTSPGFDDDAVIDWTPRAMIIDRMLELGLGEPLIHAMVLDFGQGTLAAHDAIARLPELPLAIAGPLALELVDELETERSRCEDVVALADFIRSRGLDVPVWSADLSSDCDVFYVLCTGLQPDLEQLVTGPRGFEIVETCADDRPQDKQTAEDQGLEACTPSVTREPSFSNQLSLADSAALAAACGTTEALAELRYTCGVLIELEIYRYETSRDRSGHVRIDRLEILHTTAS